MPAKRHSQITAKRPREKNSVQVENHWTEITKSLDTATRQTRLKLWNIFTWKSLCQSTLTLTVYFFIKKNPRKPQSKSTEWLENKNNGLLPNEDKLTIVSQPLELLVILWASLYCDWRIGIETRSWLRIWTLIENLYSKCAQRALLFFSFRNLIDLLCFVE